MIVPHFCFRSTRKTKTKENVNSLELLQILEDCASDRESAKATLNYHFFIIALRPAIKRATDVTIKVPLSPSKPETCQFILSCAEGRKCSEAARKFHAKCKKLRCKRSLLLSNGSCWFCFYF